MGRRRPVAMMKSREKGSMQRGRKKASTAKKPKTRADLVADAEDTLGDMLIP